MPEINPLIAAVESTFSDLANASGNMQAIKDGVVYPHLWSGVTRGTPSTSGQSAATIQAIQTATLAGIMAAEAWAAANGCEVKFIAGTYEYYGANGNVPPISSSGFKITASQGVNFVQFCPNAPILTIGDTTGNNYAVGLHWSGGRLNYGVSQTGNTSAVALLIGAATGIVVDNIGICDYYGTNPPWIGLRIYAGPGSGSAPNQFDFQNAIRDIGIGGAQQSLWTIEGQGTGSLFENVYTHDGSSNSTRITLNGPAWLFVPTNYNQTSDNEIERGNIEHSNANALVQCQGVIGCVLITPHFEDNQLIGNNASVFSMIGGDVKAIDLYLLDLAIAGSATNPAVVNCAGYGETVDIDGLNIKWSGYSNGIVGKLISLVVPPDNGGTDSNPRVTLKRIRVEDDVGNNLPFLQIDPILGNTGLGNGAFIAEYTYDNFLPTTKGFQMVIATTSTIVGLHKNPWLNIASAVPGGTFTGGIGGNTLTVSAVGSGVSLASLPLLITTGAAAGTTIVSQQSGTTGGAGSYTTSGSTQTVAAGTAMTAGIAIYLSNKLKSSGQGSSIPTDTGNRITYRRQDNNTITGGPVSFLDVATGNVLATSTAAGNGIFEFSGTSYAVAA